MIVKIVCMYIKDEIIPIIICLIKKKNFNKSVLLISIFDNGSLAEVSLSDI